MDIYSIISLLGGLGVFIYGMQMLGDGLEKTAGNKLKTIIEKLTTNRYMGFIVGCLVTFIIQSSSATTVMVVGFVNASLMTLSQAVGVILGANVGTTITAQLIALKFTAIAPIFAFIGLLLMLNKKNQKMKDIGFTMFGFAILFIGMNIMGDAMKPLQNDVGFQQFMVNFSNPLLGIAIGTLVTSIIQSSSVSIGLLQTMAMSGLITLQSSIFLVLGMNIGTCITAVFASIGCSKNAQRVSVIHVTQKILATAIFLGLMMFIPFASIVEGWSPGDATRQIANLHTLFNVIGVIFLLPIAQLTIKFSKMLIPETASEQTGDERRVFYIEKRLLQTPVIAQAQISKEIKRLGQLAYENMEDAKKVILDDDIGLLHKIIEKEDTIDFLTENITNYMMELQTGNGLSPEEERKIGQLYHVIIDMERIGDYAENVVEYAQKMKDIGIVFSEEADGELNEIYDAVLNTYALSLQALETKEQKYIDETRQSEDMVDDLIEKSLDSHIDRLSRHLCDATKGVVYTNLLNDLERVSDHAENIALCVKPKKQKSE